MVNDIRKISTVNIKRCLMNSRADIKDAFELLSFTDASRYAYAAVIYLKSMVNDESDVDFVFSKTRLAPIDDNLTIPG